MIRHTDSFLLDVDKDYNSTLFEIFPSHIQCTGNETELSECSFATKSICNHNDDVKVVCGPVPTLPTTTTIATTTTTTPLTTTTSATTTEPSVTTTTLSTTTTEASPTLPENRAIKDKVEVRLFTGFTDNVGRLEIRYNGTWGTVCGDRWSVENAAVVCSQLHFP